jgi:four helix bundle protein
MQDFRKLRAWISAKTYCVTLYDMTRRFPPDERFGLTSQMRRAARSICANLAEGCGYTGGRDSARFYQMAQGSSSESHSDLIIAQDLSFLDAGEFRKLEDLLVPTRKQISRLITVSR